MRSWVRGRRVTLLSTATVLSMGLLLVATLTACGSTATSTSSGNDSGTAVYAMMYTPVSDWDPSVESGYSEVLSNVYERLLDYDANADKFVPVLAESYTSSDDGLTWTFRIRSGVKFHDGSPVDAEAVKYSIERTIKLGKGMSFIWDPVKRVVAKDPQTVVFKLKYPAALDVVASASLGSFIMSPTAIESNPAGWLSEGHDAGSGPYMLTDWQKGRQAVTERFPDYWKGWDGKHFSAVVYQVASEASVRRLQIESGEADVTVSLTSQDVDALKSNPEVRVESNPSYLNYYLLLNTAKAPLDDVTVRMALTYAFPYDAVVADAGEGNAQRARTIVPAGLWGSNPEAFPYETDLEKAKSLLAEAGHAEGLTLDYLYASGDEYEKRMGETFAASLAEIGVKLQVRGVPFESLWTITHASDPEKRQDIVCQQWWPTVPTPADYLYSILVSQDPIQWNWSYWVNPEFDALVMDGAAKTATDREGAIAAFEEAQSIAGQQVPAIPTVDMNQVFVLTSSFKGFVFNPAYQKDVPFYECYRE